MDGGAFGLRYEQCRHKFTSSVGLTIRIEKPSNTSCAVDMSEPRVFGIGHSYGGYPVRRMNIITPREYTSAANGQNESSLATSGDMYPIPVFHFWWTFEERVLNLQG